MVDFDASYNVFSGKLKSDLSKIRATFKTKIDPHSNQYFSVDIQPIFKIKVAYESYGNSEENEVSHVQIEACIPDLEGKMQRSF